MSKKKGPPAALPKTRAELEHEKTLARKDGVAKTLVLMLYILLDKYGWNTDQLQEMMGHVRSQLSCIDGGYVNFKDLERILREEYGVEV